MRSLSQLQELVRNLGIDPARKSKEQLMDILASHFSAGRDVLPQIHVMLARDFKDLSEAERRILFNSGEWAAEPKLDGCHFKLHIGRNGQNRLDSRRRSDVDFIFSEKTGNFPQFAKLNLEPLMGTVLDGEILMNKKSIDTGAVVTKGTLTSSVAVANCGAEKSITIQKRFGWAQFWVFDIIWFKGQDVRDWPYMKRRKLLERIYNGLSQRAKKYLKLVGSHVFGTEREFREYYEHCLQAGLEGVMLKHIRGVYSKSPGSRLKAMYKWKEFTTIDAFISGFLPADPTKGFADLIGSFEVSVFTEDGKEHKIGACQPGTLETRKKASVLADSKPQLNPEFLGKVVEVRFQRLTKTFRGRHCVLLRWRPDKSMHQCTVTKEQLQSWSD